MLPRSPSKLPSARSSRLGTPSRLSMALSPQWSRLCTDRTPPSQCLRTNGTWDHRNPPRTRDCSGASILHRPRREDPTMGRITASRVATGLAAWLALAVGPGCSSHDPLPGAKPDGQHPSSDAGSAPGADAGGPIPGTDAGGPIPGTDAGGPVPMGTDGAATPDSSAAGV